MLLKARHVRDVASGSCPYHRMARLRCRRVRRSWVRVGAATALAVPHIDPSPSSMEPSSAGSAPIIQHVLMASHYVHIKELFAAHRTEFSPTDLAVAWVRLAKVSKDPADRSSPDLQRFVDIMACASIDRMPHFSATNLCSIIWAASRLKRGQPQSGMFRSFLKSWAAQLVPFLDSSSSSSEPSSPFLPPPSSPAEAAEAETDSLLTASSASLPAGSPDPQLDLEQLRKALSSLARLGFTPAPTLRLKLQAALACRLAEAAQVAKAAAAAAAAGGGGGSGGFAAATAAGCGPRTLASCLVAAASVFGSAGGGVGVGVRFGSAPAASDYSNHSSTSSGNGNGCGPSAAFRQAAAAACEVAFWGAPPTASAAGAAWVPPSADGVGTFGGGNGAHLQHQHLQQQQQEQQEQEQRLQRAVVFESARCACSALWAAATLGVPLGAETVKKMLSYVVGPEAGGEDAEQQQAQRGHPTLTSSDSSSAAGTASSTATGSSSGPAGTTGSSSGPAGTTGSSSGGSGSGDSSCCGGDPHALGTCSGSNCCGGETELAAAGVAGPVTECATAAVGLAPLDYAQVFWALSKLRQEAEDSPLAPASASAAAISPTPPSPSSPAPSSPSPLLPQGLTHGSLHVGRRPHAGSLLPASRPQLSRLLGASCRLLPAATPDLLATMMWALADLQVVPPAAWYRAACAAFSTQLPAAGAQALQALLHSAATLQLPPPQWAGRLMERLQVVDLSALPDGNLVDLVMSLHSLGLHPPPQLAQQLQAECLRRLAASNDATAVGEEAAAAAAAGEAGNGVEDGGLLGC